MCGIFGFIDIGGKYEAGLKEAVGDFLLAGQVRGVDGTGMVAIHARSQEVDWIKSPESAGDFLKRPNVPAFINAVNGYQALIGHHRAATRGKLTVENTHPFNTDHIHLVHNGTLSYTGDIYKGKDLEVDSAMICHHIAKEGVQSFVDRSYGAYALVWFDEKEGSMNFLRNDQRPLTFLRTQENYLFYCSEKQMGEWILWRRGFKVTDVVPAVPMTHYHFDWDSKKPTLRHLTKKVHVSFPNPPITPLATRGNKPQNSYRSKRGNVISMRHDNQEMAALVSEYATKKEILFSLADFVEPTSKKMKFIPIVGEVPHHECVRITANFSLPEDENERKQVVDSLWACRNMLKGKIAARTVKPKSGTIELFLSGVTVSDVPDPFFKNDKKDDKKEEKSAKKSDTPEETSEGKSGKTVSTDCCADCGHKYTRVKQDFPYILIEGGEGRAVCNKCYTQIEDLKKTNTRYGTVH